MQMTDNAGATDEQPAPNYLAVRYPAIYGTSPTSSRVTVRSLAWTFSGRRSAACARSWTSFFSYTNRNTDVVDKCFMRVDGYRQVPVPRDEAVAVLRPLNLEILKGEV